MATICPFRRMTENKTSGLPSPAQDRELELAAIIADAEMAFNQVHRTRANMAA
jgi:hypothetical protein